MSSKAITVEVPIRRTSVITSRMTVTLPVSSARTERELTSEEKNKAIELAIKEAEGFEEDGGWHRCFLEGQGETEYDFFEEDGNIGFLCFEEDGEESLI
jgi:hypothetical protein